MTVHAFPLGTSLHAVLESLEDSVTDADVSGDINQALGSDVGHFEVEIIDGQFCLKLTPPSFIGPFHG